jgi:peptide/nickel transport system substrate-binding protein
MRGARLFARAATRLVACAALIGGGMPAHASESHAIAMHGAPALPADFTHFGYANPAAPKGGRLVQGVLGSFDSLNPFIVKGLAPQGLRAPLVSANNAISGYVVESLMVRGYDEPFTLYGLLAKTVETDAARGYVTFALDPDARFSDGTPVTPDDVAFTWALLRDHGRPNHRTYYSKVTKAEVLDERRVRFNLPGDDRELPLILGLMPVLAKHAVDPDTFEDTSMTPLIGSGPYRVSQVDPGKSITFARNPDYWGRDLPANRGFWNFDEVPSTITATPIRTTRRSRRACSTSARRMTRGAGRRLTTFLLSATSAWSRRPSRRACRSRA